MLLGSRVKERDLCPSAAVPVQGPGRGGADGRGVQEGVRSLRLYTSRVNTSRSTGIDASAITASLGNASKRTLSFLIYRVPSRLPLEMMLQTRIVNPRCADAFPALCLATCCPIVK